jgi:3-oxoacyl-[acyl-carrier protein] reductase
MKIAMTGFTGGIGSIICEELKLNNIEVIKIKEDLTTNFTVDIVGVDGLIYCAGVNNVCPFQKTDFDDFDKILRINSLSFIKLCQQIKFNDESNIIALGSLYATFVKPERLMYTFSKHALLGAVKTLALEMSNRKIKVNMISPGFVDTPLTRKNNTLQRISELNDLIPLGLTDSSQIAKMCLYLVQNNQAITGQNLIIDGGYSCVVA